MKLMVSTDLFQTLNESSQHSFFFCAIKKIICTPQSECLKKKSPIPHPPLAAQIRCTLKKRKNFPQGIVLQEKKKKAYQ